jgi:hypothetical protein
LQQADHDHDKANAIVAPGRRFKTRRVALLSLINSLRGKTGGTVSPQASAGR